MKQIPDDYSDIDLFPTKGRLKALHLLGKLLKIRFKVNAYPYGSTKKASIHSLDIQLDSASD